MTVKNEVENISNNRKELMFELEKQNIEQIKELIKQNNPVRSSKKNIWSTYEYSFNNCTIYKLTNEKDIDNSTILVTYNNLKGLTWKDLINIQEDNIEFNTNIEYGAWITYYKNKIRYIVSYNKEIIASIQIEKKENKIIILEKAKTKELEKLIINNLTENILLIDILRNITYDNNEINKFLEELNKYCMCVNRTEFEKQLLIIEKGELQENIDVLTKKINSVTKQVEKLTECVNAAEEKSKKTISEIDRVKNENENLKNSIFNARKMIAKKCAYIPILGKLIIRDLNMEFGENALPNGK